MPASNRNSDHDSQTGELKNATLHQGRQNAALQPRALFGPQILNIPTSNKATAFSIDERRSLGISGLLPTAVETLETQIARRRVEYDQLHDNMQRHIFLRTMQDDNETLFYGFTRKYLSEVLPILYTPTVGTACQQFSRIYRRPRGIFISYPERNEVAAQFAAVDSPIDIIVITDGERILGLGDQGIGGIGIPIGKLSLYSAVGGIHPANVLPIVLDCGTNNPTLLNDPLYMGWREKRITGPDYYRFVDTVVQEITQRFPNALLQWEDFAQPNAAPLLAEYRNQLLSFNDDIQGTAAVALAVIEAGLAHTNDSLANQRICIVGAGSAGTGIAAMVTNALQEVGVADPTTRLFLVDQHGLLHEGRNDLTQYQQPFVHKHASTTTLAAPTESLLDVVTNLEPTVLLGVSGAGGIFTREVVEQMAANTNRPIILPMSNPTSKAEATPTDILAWTKGKALVATGSPFAPVDVDGKQVTISQANNVYVFPGVGLGAVAVGATKITDSMMVAAAKAVAAPPSVDNQDATNGLLPSIDETSAVALRVAEAVAEAAVVAGVAPSANTEQRREAIDRKFWEPHYSAVVNDNPNRFPSVTGPELPWLTESQMLEIDRIMVEDLHIGLVQMMENAGRNLSRFVSDRFRPRSVIVLAGSGGNGGGGLVAARHLHNQGIDVSVSLSKPVPQMQGVTAHQLDIIQRMGISILEEPEPADVVIDALIGYSLRDAPHGRVANLIEWSSAAASALVSLDTPSGLDVTDGSTPGVVVSAAATLTLAAPKLGLRNRNHVGELYLADISVPASAYSTMGISEPPTFSNGSIMRVIADDGPLPVANVGPQTSNL